METLGIISMNFWKNKKVMLTGADGFVGSHLAEKSNNVKKLFFVEPNCLSFCLYFTTSTLNPKSEINPLLYGYKSLIFRNSSITVLSNKPNPVN